ncbi:ABC transporter permease [Lactobacillus sp. DCY120]|uniref:ABC transporter permease n=1 Tax=Bombilactobacillus apium TaxID=2675299 RepID=A0A850QYU2_9LACO|nr:ABC transporter permease [Bombilactobacillus apium]NVY95863.1 ABC transporter permease [Bombilactobacillus apium]
MFRPKYRGTTLLSVLTLAFLIGPLIVVFITAFGSETTITFPIHGVTGRWFQNIGKQPDFLQGFQTSLEIALVASLGALLIGIPAVYALTRCHLQYQTWFQTIFLSPAFVPEIVVGFALYQGLVITCHFPLILALLLGHILLCLPYTIRLLTASLLLLDPHLEEAAAIYGCPWKTTFIKVVLPNIYPSILGALSLSFITSFNNIPITLFLNGPDLNLLPTAILNYLQNNYDPTVSAISVILMLITALLMVLIERILGLKSILN